MVKPITDDLVFKHIMSTNKEYVKKLIHYITKIPIEELQDIKFLDTNLTEEHINIKHQRSDMLVNINDTIVNLEMNNNPDDEYLEKNISYLFSIHNQNNKKSEKYTMGKKYILLNFDYNGKVGDKLINKYTVNDNGKLYPISIEIYHIKLDYLQNIEYTKNEQEELIRYLKIMIISDEKELEKISGGDKILKQVVREMLHYDAKDVPFGYRDVEEENRFMINSIKDRYEKKGRAEGKTEGTNDTIIKMYSGGIGKELIANALNMSLEQLDEILKSKNNMEM